MFIARMIPSRLRAFCLSSCFLFLALCPGPRCHAGPPTSDKAVEVVPPPDDRFQFSYETAINLGINNPNNYIINPQIFEVRFQPRKAEQFFHTPFTFSHQWEVTGVAVPFLQGPEHHYFGLGIGTRLVYTKPGSHWSIFVDGKFVAGFIDASGPPHGQGEDLTFSPMVNGGVLYEISPRQKIGLSLFYEHFSNAGLSEPEVRNEGLNTIGPMIEYNVSF